MIFFFEKENVIFIYFNLEMVIGFFCLKYEIVCEDCNFIYILKLLEKSIYFFMY